LGHEACGTIVEFGEAVVDLDVEQRVVLLWITPCRHCFHCAQGESHLCSTHPSA
jgi:S-(hydroxymethyl)glutathione dehydrogenase/alcohol dehydrogenase